MIQSALSGLCTILLGAFVLVTAAVHAAPLSPADVDVIDGATVSVSGKAIRLAGMDAPAIGRNAHCGLERMLAARAASRLRQLIRSGEVDLQLIPCACAPGTENSARCNQGHACGVLSVSGEDVATTMIAENLAHPVSCGRYTCSAREPWCPFETKPSDDVR